jgi:hypothetical protein
MRTGIRTLGWLFAGLPLLGFFAQVARAGEYEALCGGSKCSILVTQEEITSPFGSIPTSRVTYWGNTGESKTSVGTGVATTILFGGIGLLGFLAKNHNYNYFINGFDASGRKVAMQFTFKNDKPAKLLMQELTALTGLGMGQTRTVEEIKSAESGKLNSPGAIVRPEEKLGPMVPARK